jgi:phosphoribosylaminoimidazole-succinocarboxamide synthase
MSIVYKTDLPGVLEPRRGKVRDIYEMEKYILIVATDRISAFDVIMNEPIPEKGKILSQISISWFNRTKHIIRIILYQTM